jgi:hypothetical protein
VLTRRHLPPMSLTNTETRLKFSYYLPKTIPHLIATYKSNPTTTPSTPDVRMFRIEFEENKFLAMRESLLVSGGTSLLTNLIQHRNLSESTL